MKNFIVFCYARTGSYRFMDILNRQDNITAYGEVFKNQRIELSPDILEKLGLKNNDTELRDSAPIEFYNKLAKLHDNQHFGFKIFPGHNYQIRSYLAKKDDLIKIYLVRNPIQSYISVKLAQKTGKWVVKKDSVVKKDKVQIDFSLDDFSNYLSRHINAYTQVKIWSSLSNEDVHTLDYSHAVDSDKLSKFVETLGLPCSTIETEHKKVISRPYNDVVSNWDEVNSYFSALGVSHEMTFLDFIKKVVL